MALGGKRPGAGRKKGKANLEHEVMRAFIREKVIAEKEELIDSQLQKARGCWALDKKDGTGDKIYEIPPDPNAFKVLMEHGFGKPRQDVDITSGGKSLAEPRPEQLERFARRHAQPLDRPNG